MFEGIFVRQTCLLAFIDNRNQTGGSYLSRYGRRGRKRRWKGSASCWNLSEIANFVRTVCTDVAFGELRLLKTVAETTKSQLWERRELSPPSASRFPQVFTADFDILYGNFCSCCAMRARLRNGALELRKLQKIVPKMYLSLTAQMR